MIEICFLDGYEDVKRGYFVSCDGKIFSKRDNAGNITDVFKEKKFKLTRQGYCEVALETNSGKGRTKRVHRIVASAFLKKSKNHSQVNHKDRNKLNNDVSNLEWCTAKENSRHASSKPMYQYDTMGNLIKVYKYAFECIDEGFGYHAFNVARGIERTHKGFIFSYTELSKDDIIQRLSKRYAR